MSTLREIQDEFTQSDQPRQTVEMLGFDFSELAKLAFEFADETEKEMSIPESYKGMINYVTGFVLGVLAAREKMAEEG